MRQAFFCYELNNSSQWIPVIYYDELPTRSVNGKESMPERMGNHPIPSELIKDDEVFASFSSLKKLFPPPLTKGTFRTIVKKEKEIDMARPVQGFMTSQGSFFDTQEEADFYEASYDLNILTTGAVVDLFTTLDLQRNEEFEQATIDGLMQFLEQNEEQITKYYETKRALNAIPKSLQLSGESAEVHPSSGDDGDQSERSEPEDPDKVLRK